MLWMGRSAVAVEARVSLGVGAACLALVLGCASARSTAEVGTERFQFALIGDEQYNVESEAQFSRLMADLDRSSLAFVVHVGDFKAGTSMRCSDKLFRSRKEQFEASRHPFIYTPGDNEWTDCHNEAAGKYEPIERLAKLREIFFADRRSRGGGSWPSSARTPTLATRTSVRTFAGATGASCSPPSTWWATTIFSGERSSKTPNTGSATPPISRGSGRSSVRRRVRAAEGWQSSRRPIRASSAAFRPDGCGRWASVRRRPPRPASPHSSRPWRRKSWPSADLSSCCTAIRTTSAWISPCSGPAKQARATVAVKIENFTRVESFGFPRRTGSGCSWIEPDPGVLSFKEEIVETNRLRRP